LPKHSLQVPSEISQTKITTHHWEIRYRTWWEILECQGG